MPQTLWTEPSTWAPKPVCNASRKADEGTTGLMTAGLKMQYVVRTSISDAIALIEMPPSVDGVALPFSSTPLAFVPSSGHCVGFCPNQRFPNSILLDLSKRLLPLTWPLFLGERLQHTPDPSVKSLVCVCCGLSCAPTHVRVDAFTPM